MLSKSRAEIERNLKGDWGPHLGKPSFDTPLPLTLPVWLVRGSCYYADSAALWRGARYLPTSILVSVGKAAGQYGRAQVRQRCCGRPSWLGRRHLGLSAVRRARRPVSATGSRRPGRGGAGSSDPFSGFHDCSPSVGLLPQRLSAPALMLRSISLLSAEVLRDPTAKPIPGQASVENGRAHALGSPFENAGQTRPHWERPSPYSNGLGAENWKEDYKEDAGKNAG